jgi:hypothetical protein
MRFQIRDGNAGLCFIEAATAEEALSIFLTNTLRAMEKVLHGAVAVLHTENGRPASLTFVGEKFYAVSA